MSVQTAGPLVAPSPRRPVVLSLDDLVAPRTAASEVAAAPSESAAGESCERTSITAGRWLGLVGSAAFAGWTSLTCFVC